MPECAWCLHRTHTSQPAEFICAYICDKCARIKIIDLCHHDFTQWKNTSPRMHCPECGGTLSWKARHLTNGQQEWYFNPGPDND